MKYRQNKEDHKRMIYSKKSKGAGKETVTERYESFDIN